MTLKNGTSIGVEIEVNNLTQELYDSIDWNLWNRDHEHCGTELRSIVCRGAPAIKRLVDSIGKFSGDDKNIGFHNAGTHIHFDFLTSQKTAAGELLKRHSSRRNNATGQWHNPFGNGRRWFWTDSSGNTWDSPAAYRAANGININKQTANSRTPAHILNSVKRFMCMGVRFAEVLLCLQHPDRRVNKYCHTIAGWSEADILAATSVAEIASHPKLAQNHRRLMINPLSFAKWGTIEIRMIKASIDADEIWSQIFLFGKMAALAKSNEPIPHTTGKIPVDFGLLLDACEIHGKMRRYLTDKFRENFGHKGFKCICYNSNCLHYGRHEEFVDYGLSRMLCKACHNGQAWCANCGAATIKNKKLFIDEKIDGGRYICNACLLYHVKPDDLLSAEKNGKFLSSLGIKVGTDFDDEGFKTLRRMHGLFS